MKRSSMVICPEGTKPHVSRNIPKLHVRALDAAVWGGRVFTRVLQVNPNVQDKVEAYTF